MSACAEGKHGGARGLSLAVLLTTLLTASAAPAFEVRRAADGQPRRWTSFPLQLRVAPPSASIRSRPPFQWLQAVRSALATWQEVDNAGVSVRFAGLVTAGASLDPAPGEVVLSFDEGAFPGSPDLAGLTDLESDPADAHVISAAHIHLNARDFALATDGGTDALDVETITLHELGHALGLAHPCGDLDTETPSCDGLPAVRRQALQAAAMWPSIQAGARRTLAQDDRDGISFVAPVLISQPAPALDSVGPACATSLAGLTLAVRSVRLGGADRFQLASDGHLLADLALGRDAEGKLQAKLPGDFALPVSLRLPAKLDALLVSSLTTKAGELQDALLVGGHCGSGCSSSGWESSALLLVPLAWWASRRRKGNATETSRGRANATTETQRSRVPVKRAVSGLAVAVVLLLAAGPAVAYKRSVNAGGLCTFWSSRGHTFMIDARGTPDVPGSASFEAIRQSFATWSGVACSDLVFPDLGLSQDPADRKVGFVPGAYNRNLVLFRTASCRTAVPAGDDCLTSGGCGNKYDCWDHPGTVIATTTTTSNRFTGQIADSDIELNDAPAQDGSKFTFSAVDSPPCLDVNQTNCVNIDIRNTVTHEAGHTIGLDHSTDPSATMYATAPAGETAKRQLHDDDKLAVCDIYPNGAPTVTCLGDPIAIKQTGSSDGKSCGCTSDGGAAPALQGTLLASLWLLAHRRKART